jgi:hypothetical protein
VAQQTSGGPSKRLVRLKDAAHILGVPIEVFPDLVQGVGCKILADRWSTPCLEYSEFQKLHDHPQVIASAQDAALNEAEQRVRDKLSGANERFVREIREKLKEYREYIRLLQRVHHKYLDRIQPLQRQNGLSAAYLLYARVINLLHLGCVCIEAGYWNAGIVLRQIDEAIQVAEYFSTGESTPEYLRDVEKWFRENRSPQPSDMRKADAKRLGELMGQEQGERHLYVMNELYELKSKWIHPTFSPVRETLQTTPQNDQAVVVGFDYEASTFPRKLHEITLFYRSSIWTAVQGFLLSFQHQIPLDPADSEELLALNRKFTDEPDGL